MMILVMVGVGSGDGVGVDDWALEFVIGMLKASKKNKASNNLFVEFTRKFYFKNLTAGLLVGHLPYFWRDLAVRYKMVEIARPYPAKTRS